MSNTRAIAAVTATLKELLGRVDEPIGLDLAAPGLANPTITVKPPEHARPSEKPNQLNLFLYQVTPNAAFRNMNVFGSDGSGTTELPLALNLHYLLTAYGDGDEDHFAHLLLGRAMALFHRHAVLSRTDIRDALAGNDLYQQVEQVRITPVSLGNEEMSKLWTTFQTGYRISVAYEVSVVLIDTQAPKTAPLPVLQRGRANQGVDVYADLIPRAPTLTRIDLPNSQPSARIGRPAAGPDPVILGDTLEYKGFNLTGTTVVVDFEHLTQAARIPHPPASVTATNVSIVLPQYQDTWPAGIYRTSVRVSNATDPDRSSNALYVAIAPRITIDNTHPSRLPPDGDIALQLRVSPEIWPGQRAVLIFGDREILVPPRTTNVATLNFTIDTPPGGTHAVRLRVDGVESLLIQDYSASPPTYDPNQRVAIT